MKALIKTCQALTITAIMIIGAAACPDPDRRADNAKPKDTSGTVSLPATAGVDAEDPSTVVATIGEEEVTLAQLDEELTGELHQAKMEHRMAIYELRRAGIDRLIAKKLFAEEAERLGLEDEEAFIQQSVEKGTPFPSEEEAREFFEQNRQMMGGQDFEAMQARVTQFLHQQKKQEQFHKVLRELREKADVEIHLAEPRVDVEAKGPSKGPEDAPVTIVEFSDYLCPFCVRGKKVMDEVAKEYGDKVRFVFRLFPTMENEPAVRAAEAAACADAQGRFWEMHELLFAAGRAYSKEDIEGYAKSIEGLDETEFEACLESKDVRERVMRDILAGHSVGVSGTPAFFVNGIPLLGAQPFETFKEVIDSELGLDGTESAATTEHN